MSTEHISKNISAQQERVLRDAEIIITSAYTTTASFADVTGAIIDAANYESVAIVLKNTGGANGASWKILGSIDGVTYVEVVASGNVAFGAVGTPYTVSIAPYRYYKVQAVDQVGAAHTTVVVHLIGK
jgi:hypothetical protein